MLISHPFGFPLPANCRKEKQILDLAKMFCTIQKVKKHNLTQGLKVTALILANKNSNMRGVIPRFGLGLTSNSSISPSIVWVFPLPVYVSKHVQIKIGRKKEGERS